MESCKAKLLFVVMAVALGSLSQAMAQDATDEDDVASRFFPRQSFLLAGYGATGYDIVFLEDGEPNNFNAVFAPIMLFQISDRFLFEGEFEFEIEEGVSATALEYAQIDGRINDNLILVGGKFLLPFATFSERYHPTWINRLISAPALYGSHGGALPATPMLPILSDIGVQLRGSFEVGPFSSITAEAFVTQGPSVAEEDHNEEAAAVEEEDHGDVIAAAKRVAIFNAGTAPDGIGFQTGVSDNNENKLVGGRVGYVIAPYFEINLSGMTGKYDDEGALRFSAAAAHVEGRMKGFTFHSEIIQTWQDLAVDDDHDLSAKAPANLNESDELETLSRVGYWLQVGYRWGKLQPVIRWTHLLDGDIGSETVVEGGRQLALGLDYWFEPSLVLKVEYLRNEEDAALDNDRLALQVAFGF